MRLLTEDAEADRAELMAHSVEVDSDLIRMGEGVPPMFLLRDPDGNRFVVVEKS